MGKDVAEASPAAAQVFREADEILGFDLSRACFEGPQEQLMRTDVQQPAIFATSVAIWRAMQEAGTDTDGMPQAVAGLSLGEYTALHVAGSLSFPDALKLVRRRGELMQQAATAVAGGMVSVVGGDESTAEALCADASEGDVLGPANFNCPGQIVISGSKAACGRALERASKHGVRAVALKVAGAFHSAIMASAADGLAEALASVEIHPPRCPVICNVDARAVTDADDIRDCLRRQLVGAVRWQQSIERLIETGFARFVEVGPGRVLTGLMRKIDRSVQAVNVSSRADLKVEQSVQR